MKILVALALTQAACLTAAGSMMVGPLLALTAPGGTVADGAGSVTKEAQDRIASRASTARAEATRDALAAADAAPADLRLQRRAVAMVRSCVADSDAKVKLAELAPHATATVERLVATTPCPGLADAAATWVALGDNAKGGEAYVAAARECDTPEAAVAAVRPLHAVDRCDLAVETLRAAWPKVHGAKSELAIEILDGVTTCSDSLTLRRNLAFVPPDVMDGYFALLEAREREAREAARQAEIEREREDERQRAWAASSSCRSECSAAVSSCEASCQGGASCSQRCSSIGHVCSSGCGS